MSQLVDLKVGFACNNNCLHCVVSDKFSERDLTFEEIKKLIEKYIEKYSTISLTLTGGEITIRKDYNAIMDFVSEKKENGLIEFVDIQTNGRNLSNDDLLSRTIPVVDFYLVALHSSDPAVHDEVTDSPNSFQETTEALSKLVANGVVRSIAIQTVISRFNYESLLGIYEFCHKQFGIIEYNITFPHPLGVAYDSRVTPRYSDIRSHVNEAVKYCLENGIKPFLEALPYCVFDEQCRAYAIDFYGSRSCEVVGYGGEKDGHIDYSLVSEEGHGKYASCMKCEYNGYCVGVWKEYIMLYPDDDLHKLLARC